MTLNGLVALVISGEKTVEKLFHFLFFFAGVCWLHLYNVDQLLVLRDKLFIGERMISCLEKRKAMR